MNIQHIRPTAAVALADKARELELGGKSIIKLQTGDPDFDTNSAIVDAAYKALKEGLTHYSFSQGLPILRDRIATLLNEELSSDKIDKDWILITNGAAEGIYATMAGLLEKDDEVIILEPNWPTVDSLATLMGASVKKVSSFQSLDNLLDQLEKKYTTHTKLICFNSPNNPTGQVYSQETLDSICAWAMGKDIYILADEVYRFLQFTSQPSTSVKNLIKYPKYIYADSFSKKFAMTGWRIGYIVSNPETLKNIAKASQLTVTHVAPFIQKAALEAITNPLSFQYSEQMKEVYDIRRQQLLKEANILRLQVINPEGAFYLFIKLQNNIDDMEFCNRILDEKNVCVVPGSAFGESGKGYVRLSYATEIENSIEGLRKINEMLQTYE